MKVAFWGFLLLGMGIFWLWHDTQEETLARLKQTHALQWKAKERKKYPKEYATRREQDLPTIPLKFWTSNEKNTHPIVFLKIFQKDLEKSLESLEADLKHWKEEVAKNQARQIRLEAQRRKIRENLRVGVKIRKAGKYPAQFQDASLSQKELEELLLSLHELDTQKKEEEKACSRAVSVAKEQLTLKKHLLAEHRRRISFCQASLQRARNGARIENMNQLLEQIKKGNSAAEQLDKETTEIFVRESVKALGQDVSNQETLLSLEKEFQ